MPRSARVIVANMPHHIVQRGHNRNIIFFQDKDYEFYLNTLREWKQKLSFKIYAWCLMANHVHLILDPGNNPESISLLMKRLAGRQTRYVNKQMQRTGSLWDGRYKASIIETNTYLMQCCRYVELNPVKAAIVSQAQAYPWSSYNAKIGLAKCDWLDIDVCYQSLKKPHLQYKEFVEQGISEEEQQFISERLKRNQLTGNQEFIDEIERKIGIRIETRSPGRPKMNKSVNLLSTSILEGHGF